MADVFAIDPTATAETFSGSAWASSTPVWNAITAQIKTAIDAMTIANGYKYNYGAVDEFNIASRTYPAILLRYTSETGLNERENELNKYTCEQQLQIVVIGEDKTSLDQTVFLYRADFNKMFYDFRDIFQAVGMGEAVYTGSEYSYKMIKNRPMEIVLRYTISYSRQKKNPYLT
jgi:hypothetical protein